MEWSIKSFSDLTLHELYELLALRTAVFVVEQNCPYQEVDHKDQECYHVCGYENGDLVAYARILPKGLSFEQISIGRVLIAKNQRGRQLATQLMARCLAFISEELGETSIQISAQEYLDSFYRSLGFEPVSEVYLEDGIPHQDMLLQIEK